MKVFVIGSVRNAREEQRDAQAEYVAQLRFAGHQVCWPPDDTDQTARGITICQQNRAHVEWADEIHIFYDSDSQGTHFDMGMAFMARKPVVVARTVDYGPGKSYPRMIAEWANEGPE